ERVVQHAHVARAHRVPGPAGEETVAVDLRTGRRLHRHGPGPLPRTWRPLIGRAAGRVRHDRGPVAGHLRQLGDAGHLVRRAPDGGGTRTHGALPRARPGPAPTVAAVDTVHSRRGDGDAPDRPSWRPPGARPSSPAT